MYTWILIAFKLWKATKWVEKSCRENQNLIEASLTQLRARDSICFAFFLCDRIAHMFFIFFYCIGFIFSLVPILICCVDSEKRQRSVLSDVVFTILEVFPHEPIQPGIFSIKKSSLKHNSIVFMLGNFQLLNGKKQKLTHLIMTQAKTFFFAARFLGRSINYAIFESWGVYRNLIPSSLPPLSRWFQMAWSKSM